MNLCELIWGFFTQYHTDLVKELLPCGVGVEGKLQLCVHGGDADVDLQQKQKKKKRHLDFRRHLNPLIFI